MVSLLLDGAFIFAVYWTGHARGVYVERCREHAALSALLRDAAGAPPPDGGPAG